MITPSGLRRRKERDANMTPHPLTVLALLFETDSVVLVPSGTERFHKIAAASLH